MTEQFKTVAHIIKSRRSTGWAKMNGTTLPDDTIKELLELAHWAPTHGRTEPWSFFVYSGEGKARLGKDHAQLYWDNTAEDKRMQGTYDKLAGNTALASHVIIAVMKRGSNDKIPMYEEMAAASAAIQNILLGATALGIASFWSTGGMTHKQALKEYLNLGAEDIVLGILYLGLTDEPAKEGTRNTKIADKTTWVVN